MTFNLLDKIVMGVYGFSVAVNFNVTLPELTVDNSRAKVLFIGEVYHDNPDGKIRLIKIVRAATGWNLRQTKSFVEECEKIFLEDVDVVSRLDDIIEENR